MSATLLPSPSSSAPPNREASFELLCACACAKPDAARVSRIANWDFAEFDWVEFLQVAEHHGVTALVAQNLIAHGRELPAEIQQSLQTEYAANLRRSLWFSAELARILQYFAQRGVRALPFKGPVLAQRAYGDAGLRSFSDLDLLISPSDFTLAKGALAEIGYRPSCEIDPAIERMWLRTGYERSFDSPAGSNLVELQWNLLPHFYAVDFQEGDFQVEDLLVRSNRIRFGDTEVACLSPEDSLLAVCLHAAKHLWTRLIWVVDIAESLRTAGFNFDAMVARARAMGVARILGVSFWLAETLLGAPTPEAARNLMNNDREVTPLGRKYAERLARAATYDFESTGYFQQVFPLRERAIDRWRYLWRLAVTPGPGEVAVAALQERWFPLYRAVRIGRLLGKALKPPGMTKRSVTGSAAGDS